MQSTSSFILTCGLLIGTAAASETRLLFESLPVTCSGEKSSQVVPVVFQTQDSAGQTLPPVSELPPPCPPPPPDAEPPYSPAGFEVTTQLPFVSKATNGFVWIGECGEGCGEPCYRYTVGGCGEDVGCGECCGVCLCDKSCSSITAYSGGIFLKREDPSGPLLILNPANAQQHIKSGDYNFGVQTGVEAGVIVHNAFDDRDLGLRFFTVDDWSDTVDRTMGGAATVINVNPAFGIAGARAVRTGYSSRLTNVEANVRRRIGCGCDWLTVLAGFRYMNLRERYSARLVDSTQALPDTLFAVDTDNHLYGLQLGMNATICGSCNYCVEGFGRAGIYGNYAATDSAVSVLQAGGSSGSTAFVGEIGVSALYRLTESISFYGRYQVIALDGVALATRQPAVTSFATGTGHTADSSLIFHGASFGLEFAY